MAEHRQPELDEREIAMRACWRALPQAERDKVIALLHAQPRSEGIDVARGLLVAVAPERRLDGRRGK